MIRIPTHRPPTHPGEMLLEEFLLPLSMTQKEFAERIGVSQQRVNEIVKGRRGMTIDTALRTAALFQMSAEFWIDMQMGWDLYQARHTPEVTKQVQRIKPIDTRHYSRA